MGVDIQPDVIWYKDDQDYYDDLPPEELGIRYREDYKVFYIDDNPDSQFTTQYIYAIAKNQITSEWARHDFGMAENGTSEERQER